MANTSKGIRHQWPTSGDPNTRSEPERCSRCGLERRAVASTQFRATSPQERVSWRYGPERAAAAGRCAGPGGFKALFTEPAGEEVRP